MKNKVNKKGFVMDKILWILETAYVAVIPLIVVYLGYDGWGEKANKFKIGFGVLVFIVILFLIIKRVWLTKWFDKKRIEIANLSAMKKAETDERKLENINYELKKLLAIENAINWSLPLLFLGVGFAAAYALERALVTFTEILFFIGISETIGCIISFIRILRKK